MTAVSALAGRFRGGCPAPGTEGEVTPQVTLQVTPQVTQQVERARRLLLTLPGEMPSAEGALE